MLKLARCPVAEHQGGSSDVVETEVVIPKVGVLLGEWFPARIITRRWPKLSSWMDQESFDGYLFSTMMENSDGYYDIMDTSCNL